MLIWLNPPRQSRVGEKQILQPAEVSVVGFPVMRPGKHVQNGSPRRLHAQKRRTLGVCRKCNERNAYTCTQAPITVLSVRYRLDDLQNANGSPSEGRNHRRSRCERAYLIFDGTLGGYDEIKVICERFDATRTPFGRPWCIFAF